MLFYNNRSSDDRAVRRALSKVDHYGGQVFVDAHWIKSVSRYQAITRGVDVEQSPTIVVADRNLKAETLVGYVDRETIDQAVVDAIRASGGSLISNPYFRKLDRDLRLDRAAGEGAAAADLRGRVPAYLDRCPGAQRRHGDAGRRDQAAREVRKTFHKRLQGLHRRQHGDPGRGRGRTPRRTPPGRVKVATAKGQGAGQEVRRQATAPTASAASRPPA